MLHRTILIALLLLCLAASSEAQTSPHRTGVDPVAQEMMDYLDIPRPTAPPGVLTPPEGTETAGTPTLAVGGWWHIDLAQPEALEIFLYQLGTAVFGRGSLTGVNGTQDAVVSGSVVGGRLNIDAVPVDGMRLYRLRIDLTPEAPAGTYDLFIPGEQPRQGRLSLRRSTAPQR